MVAAADIVVAAVGAGNLVVAAELVVEAVVKLVVALTVAAELVVEAVVELVVALAVAAELELVEGGAVGGELGPWTEEVCDAVLTAAAAYVAGSLESSSSKKRSVGSLGPSRVATGQFS